MLDYSAIECGWHPWRSLCFMRSTLTFSPKLVKGLAFPSPGNSPSSLLLRLPVCFPRKLRGKKMKEEMFGFFVGCFLMLLVSHQWRSQLNFANWVVVLGSVGWSFLNFIGNQTGTLLILTCFVFLTFRLVFVWLPRMERWRQINECWDFVGCAVPPFK